MDLISIAVGITIGWIFGRWYMIYQISKKTETLVRDSLAELMGLGEKNKNPKASILYASSSDKYIYLYNKKTDEFICQDTNLASAVKKAHDYDKIAVLAIVESNGERLLVHEGLIVDEEPDEG